MTGSEATEVPETTASGAPWVSVVDALQPCPQPPLTGIGAAMRAQLTGAKRGGRSTPCTQTVDNVLIDMNISKTDLLALRGTHSVIHLGTRVLLLWLRSRWTLPEIISFLSSFSFSHSASLSSRLHPGITPSAHRFSRNLHLRLCL